MIAEALASDGPALALTIGVEGAVVAALSAPFRLARLRALLASVAINFITQPLFWGAMVLGPFQTPERWWPAFWIGETTIWVVEAALYLFLLPELRAGRRGLATALALSLAANAASAAAGLTLGV